MTPEEYSQLRALVEAGAHGVSADNGQPWSFHWRQSRLDLTLDKQRAQSFFDRQQFAALFGLGTVLENLSVAAGHFGYILEIEPFSRHRDRETSPIVRIALRSGGAGSHPLYPEIFRRSTNRRPYQPRMVPADVQGSLLDPFDDVSSVRLLFLDRAEQIHRIGALTAAADRIRFDFSSLEIHEDFFGCLRFTQEEASTTRDGLWLSCLEVKPPDRLALRLLARWSVARVARHLGVARIFAKQTVALLRHTPLLALLVGRSEARPGPDSKWIMPPDDLFLEGGRLGQRAWLVATNRGLACQPMAVLPLFFAQYVLFGEKGFPGRQGAVVGRLRERFHEEFGLGADEHLLMVLRLGYASPPSARSFRRPVDELLRIEDDSPLVSA